MIRWSSLWGLDPEVTFLNHGSFGAAPLAVLEAQQRLREQIEAEPVRFFVRELEALLDAARRRLADFLGARPVDLVFVANATTGTNTVLRALELEPGDELLTTDHDYPACRNALELVADRAGAKVVVAAVTFPVSSPNVVVEAVLAAVTPRTRLALVDHVTSPTGLVFPLESLVSELESRGVPVLVDGAHAPGMVEVHLDDLGASYYTGNCHKWLCAPKGAGFLHVREDRQDGLRPLMISHGAAAARGDRSRFHLEFDWTGTHDPTPYLCVSAAIEQMGAVLSGGWSELRRRNHELAVEAREIICRALGVDPPCPDSMIGSLASIPLPDGEEEPPPPPLLLDPLQQELWERHGIEVPVVSWPARPRRLLRISAQLYNTRDQYERLAAALEEALDRESPVDRCPR